MLLIPGAIGALIFVHMWLVVKLGVTPWPTRPPDEDPAVQPALHPETSLGSRDTSAPAVGD
jgi:quinol-cytochrome oxidoreductase complex cytochrome b subunit